MYGTLLEEPGQHGAYAIRAQRNAVFSCDVENTFLELSAALIYLRVNLGMSAKMLDRSQASRHGQRVPGKRACLIDRPNWRDHVHQFIPAAVGAYRKASTDDFAERRKIGLDSVKLLRAAQGETKACHHFIENKYGSVLFGDLAQKLQVPGSWRDYAHVAHHRFHNHAGNLVFELGECFFQRLLIVVWQSQCELRLLRKHTG